MGIVPEEHRMVQKDSLNEIRAIGDIKMGNENKISPEKVVAFKQKAQYIDVDE